MGAGAIGDGATYSPTSWLDTLSIPELRDELGNLGSEELCRQLRLLGSPSLHARRTKLDGATLLALMGKNEDLVKFGFSPKVVSRLDEVCAVIKTEQIQAAEKDEALRCQEAKDLEALKKSMEGVLKEKKKIFRPPPFTKIPARRETFQRRSDAGYDVHIMETHFQRMLRHPSTRVKAVNQDDLEFALSAEAMRGAIAGLASKAKAGYVSVMDDLQLTLSRCGGEGALDVRTTLQKNLGDTAGEAELRLAKKHAVYWSDTDSEEYAPTENSDDDDDDDDADENDDEGKVAAEGFEKLKLGWVDNGAEDEEGEEEEEQPFPFEEQFRAYYTVIRDKHKKVGKGSREYAAFESLVRPQLSLENDVREGKKRSAVTDDDAATESLTRTTKRATTATDPEEGGSDNDNEPTCWVLPSAYLNEAVYERILESEREKFKPRVYDSEPPPDELSEEEDELDSDPEKSDDMVEEL